MAQLAIKCHATRGREVIELLERLGGKNICHYSGNSTIGWYFIYNDKDIGWLDESTSNGDFKYYTLEEFLEKFPYKVGDKVRLDKWPCTITNMYWNGDNIIYYVKGTDFSKGVYAADLQPYKEETMEGKVESFEILEDYCSDEVKIEFDPSKFEMVERENGYYVIRKKTQYPKTYEECLEILGYNVSHTIPMNHGHQGLLIMRFQRLLILRDAYWKIAGNWKPNWGDTFIYFIGSSYGVVGKIIINGSGILVFPTEEMRDAFYENFKDLIEECKELI